MMQRPKIFFVGLTRKDTGVGLAHIYLDDGPKLEKLEAVEFRFGDQKNPLNYICLLGLRAGLNKCLELSGEVQPIVYCPFENVYFFILKELAASKGVFYQELWSIINQFPGIDFAPLAESLDVITALGSSYKELYELAEDAWEAARDICKPAPSLGDANPFSGVEFNDQLAIANAAAALDEDHFGFDQWKLLQVPGGLDQWSSYELSELCERIPDKTTRFINERVCIMFQNLETKAGKNVFTIDDRLVVVTDTLRWHLRGLSVKAALHKAGADIVSMIMERKEKAV